MPLVGVPNQNLDTTFNSFLKEQQPSVTIEELNPKKEYNPTEPYKPGFYNPNLVAQGTKAREAGGGNLQPVVEGITNALKSMSIEDWKKESTLANMLKYGVGSMPIIGDQAFYQEGKNKLIESGKSGIQALMNPKETFQAISQAEPGNLLGQLIKGGLYDAPLGPSSKPIFNAAKTVAQPVVNVGKQALPSIMQGMENLQGGLNAYKNTVNPPKQINPLDQTLPNNVFPMTGGGAANVSKQTMLQNAIQTASPELRADLIKQFEKGDIQLLNEKALTNLLEADTLPFPIRLTEGQASGNIHLLSNERNSRAANPELATRLNEQNNLLHQNAFAIKEKVAPNLTTTNYVADAGDIIDSVNAIKTSNKNAIQLAYQELEKANGGKFPVDAKLFSENANKALNVGDNAEFLPATIKKRLDDYANGKEMNFNQFENLRTQIARESRKADAANDGNAVYALSLVREQLENLPLGKDTAKLKPLADKARSLAKKDFDLERDNLLYKDVVNGKADTKDLVQKFLIGSKNKDFAKTMELLKDNPIALENLKSGVLDYINQSSTMASGNFSSATYGKLVKNLDENGKLKMLFGSDAELIKQLQRTAQRVETTPSGSYVNSSNTFVAQMGERAKSFLEQGANAITRVPIATMLRNASADIEKANRLKESLRPSAGIKLKGNEK